MSLAKTVLQKLSEWKPDATGRQVLTTRDEGQGWLVILQLDRCDGLSCLAWDLALRRTGPAPAGSLRSRAERVAARVTGLMEPLRVHEVDEARAEAQLRSREPVQRGEHILYYEILLKGTGQAVVRRYQASPQPGSQRDQVAFALTLEALGKLIDDLTAEK